jgi:hypothetical protein
MTLRLHLRTVRQFLIVTVAALVVLTFVAQVFKDQGWLPSVARFIDSDVKLNLPSVFKELALVAAALVTWLISRIAREEDDRWGIHWLVLSVIIAFLALDEMTFAHQSFGNALRAHFDFHGALHYAWVVVYGPAAVVGFVLLARFWWNMRSGLRRSLAWAGLLFGVGAAGFGLLKGSVADRWGTASLHFYLTSATSDSFEMIGMAVLLAAVLGELSRRAGEVTVSIRSIAPQPLETRAAVATPNGDRSVGRVMGVETESGTVRSAVRGAGEDTAPRTDRLTRP